MDELHIATILGNALGTGAAVATLLLILWKVLKGIAERWIASLDAVSKGLADHTAKDLESHTKLGDRVAEGHAELKEQLVRVEVKLDSDRDWRRQSTNR